ncbi:aldehyde ferredoxin oxidoreductase [Acidaminobacter sp. JC074]|uniref:aldehyde ferredoxin oxidoreductase N-terminal domain-containing protein n=1 Tax=Acidaminobacter sp. JC074 TaxID=2530199 RepID=UPI001F10CDFE|nr:aldehyde ferredoxin oxidoreductase N-terminal domain-containing protein [Acidaminobacter sp. JC074]MCH4886457.1 aldehyde ferredoxin oxidoreductase [Acidaminobacter sp. JC074]
MNKLYEIDMKTLQISYGQVNPKYSLLGGRGLIAKRMVDVVDAKCDPLGPDNHLIITTGLFAGTKMTTSSRVSIGAKSPMTQTIKEANSGGTYAEFLSEHGIKMIDIKGVSEKLELIYIDEKGQVNFIDAADYKGLNNYEVCAKLTEYFGQDISIMTIGSAGEKAYRSSAIMFSEFGSNEPVRSAARGGLGSVMGSKNIKAIVLKRAKVKANTPYVDETLFDSARKELAKIVLSNASAKARSKFGTLGGLDTFAAIGSLPVRNFRGESDERTALVNGPSLYENLMKHGGKAGLPCQRGCVVRCSNRYHGSDGAYITSGLQYETVGLLGPNCDIYDLDAIAKISRVCDDIGVDTIEIGCGLGVLMEAGIVPWGDIDITMSLMEEMKEGINTGRILGDGADAVGKHFKVSRVPVARGQAFPAYDPRATKGTGVSYATSAMGADHTAGITLGLPGDSPIEQSINSQISLAFVDNTFCLFTAGAFLSHPEGPGHLANLFKGRYGLDLDFNGMMGIGLATLYYENEFTRNTGYDDTSDSLPQFLYDEISPVSKEKFDVDQGLFKHVHAAIKKANENNPLAKL